MADKNVKNQKKILALNRKARHDYFVDETYEAGISLSGTEVKSIRAGTVNLKDSYCRIDDGELFVIGMHVSPYEKGNIFNRDPLRDRKLLADEGMVVVVMTLSAENAQLISGPDIISRGFVYEKENDKLIDELRRVAMESIAYCEDNGITDWASIKSRVKSGLSGYLFKKTRRSPMILPIIMEV